MFRNKKVIIFNMDGTLIDSIGIWNKTDKILIRQLSGMNEIAEFFVLNKYRKLGAGTFMANEIFKKYNGKWEVRTL